jgi:GNAT superfamily N-acetyltransferase
VGCPPGGRRRRRAPTAVAAAGAAIGNWLAAAGSLRGMDLLIASLAERPELPSTYAEGDNLWPAFMYQDAVGELYYTDNDTAFAEFVVVAVDPAEPDRIVARALSVPFTWEGDPERHLPVDGWDGVIRRAALDRQQGRRGNLVSALEITVRPDLQGRGLSGTMLEAMRRNAARLGFGSLVAPVRPTGKHRHQHTPITEYAAWSRADGLPHDPWLRVHVRAGGRVVGVCHRAMVVAGTLAEWRSWTGLPFDAPGPVEVPNALVPVHCDPVHDHAVYVEPAVWVHHRLRPEDGAP